MNWQVLNPLRMISPTVRVLRAVRPQVTKRRVVAVATMGLMGSAGMATHQLWKAGSDEQSPPVVAQLDPASNPADAAAGVSAAEERIEGMLANPITMIPDPGEPDENQAYAPRPRTVIAAPENPDMAGPEVAVEATEPGDAEFAEDRSVPDPSGFRPPTMNSPNIQSFAQPAAAETESNPTVPTESDAPPTLPATPDAASGTAAAEPPITIPSSEPPADTPSPVPSLPALPAAPTGVPALPIPPANLAATPPATLNPAGTPSSPGAAESPGVAPRPPAELVPVDPSRLQPDPAEQIRVPEEAVPSLSPNTLPPGNSPRSMPNPSSEPPAATGSEAGEANVPEVPATRGLDAPGPRALESTAAPGEASGSSVGGGATSGNSALDENTRSLPAIGQPGAKHLEGIQTPTLSIEKIAPSEIQVGQPATFGVRVRNTGRVVAQQVVIHDQIPRGTRLAETTPAASRGADGSLQWQVGALEPGQEATVSLRVIPEQEGEIGSVAQVTFQSLASVRTVATRPQITIEHNAPPKVLIGQPIVIQLTITNQGTGTARNLILEEVVPAGLSHPAGPELEYPVGNLRPQESKRIELTLKGLKPGNYQNVIVARTETAALAEARVPVEVQAPRMVVNVAGPKVRYLDRQATYAVSVANPGTAPATNLEVVAQLPRGLKFVSADHQGQYDPQRHTVAWGLAELPPGVAGTSQVVVVPIEPGEQRLRVSGRGDLNLEHTSEQAVMVETLSELQFAVADTADPIEVGSETTYDLRVMNRGSRTASNIQLAIDFPAELEPLSGDGPSRVQVRSGQLTIEPLARLAPNAQVAYQIKVKGLRPGDPRIRVRLTCDEAPTPVSKEESTRVYADNE